MAAPAEVTAAKKHNPESEEKRIEGQRGNRPQSSILADGWAAAKRDFRRAVRRRFASRRVHSGRKSHGRFVTKIVVPQNSLFWSRQDIRKTCLVPHETASCRSQAPA